MDDGEPVVITCQDAEFGSAPPEVTMANALQPPLRPGLTEVAVVIDEQETPIPPEDRMVVVADCDRERGIKPPL